MHFTTLIMFALHMQLVVVAAFSPQPIIISSCMEAEPRYKVLSATTPILFDDYSPGASTDLAYLDTESGAGPAAKPGDIVTVQYSGRLLSSGKQFDSGLISFKLGAGRVIPGWEKGLEGLRVGGKRTLRIPPGLAYGKSGAGGVIPPNSDLEFNCELKGISSGLPAELMATLGLGLNARTAVLLAFIFLVSWLSYSVSFPE